MGDGMRDEVRALVDNLPESELTAARRYLEYLRDMGDPVLRAVRQAPIDDEEDTADEAAAAKRAREEVTRGETTSTDELRRELGV